MSKATTIKKRSSTSKVSKKLNLEHKSGFDFLMALLVVSLLLNLFAICVWVVLRITNIYDGQLAEIFLAR